VKKQDSDFLLNRYHQRFLEYGVDIRTMAAGSQKHQKIRFQALSEVGDLNNHSILDIGCGFADFYSYLKSQGLIVDYTGYDICPDFIKVCQTKFPEANFEVRDIQIQSIEQQFDYIVSSQTFNCRLKKQDNLVVIKEILREAYDSSKIGIAIDMLSTYTDFQEDHLYYFNPEIIFNFCKRLTKRVTLRHDLPLFEFMIYLYKDFKSWNPKNLRSE